MILKASKNKVNLFCGAESFWCRNHSLQSEPGELQMENSHEVLKEFYSFEFPSLAVQIVKRCLHAVLRCTPVFRHDAA